MRRLYFEENGESGMNEDEAYKALESGTIEIPHYLCKDCTMWEKSKQVRKIALKALEKQIPKKPYFKPWDWYDDGEDGSLACPNCKDHLTDYVPDDCQKYCMNCGQKLDWSVENEKKD